MKENSYQVRPFVAGPKKLATIERCDPRSRKVGRPKPPFLSPRTIGFMVFAAAYAATSRLFGPADPIRTILNDITYPVVFAAIAISCWFDWRSRKAANPGILLQFPAYYRRAGGE